MTSKVPWRVVDATVARGKTGLQTLKTGAQNRNGWWALLTAISTNVLPQRMGTSHWMNIYIANKLCDWPCSQYLWSSRALFFYLPSYTNISCCWACKWSFPVMAMSEPWIGDLLQSQYTVTTNTQFTVYPLTLIIIMPVQWTHIMILRVNEM